LSEERERLRGSFRFSDRNESSLKSRPSALSDSAQWNGSKTKTRSTNIAFNHRLRTEHVYSPGRA